jgi:hypothetical protein
LVAAAASLAEIQKVRKAGDGRPLTLDVVMAYAWVPSDDGKSAIVEVVVRDTAAMKEFTREAGKVATISLFERGKQTPAALDIELRKVKKDFDRRSLRAVAP